MIWLSVALGAGFRDRPARAGRRDPAGIHVATSPCSTQCALLWPVFALMQPLNGAVFALDGILIGASDGRYLALSMAAAFLACVAALAAVVGAGWGVRGVWVALVVLILTRLGLMGSGSGGAGGSSPGLRDGSRGSQMTELDADACTECEPPITGYAAASRRLRQYRSSPR